MKDYCGYTDLKKFKERQAESEALSDSSQSAGSVSLWNKAIDAAVKKVEEKQDVWDEGCGFSPTKLSAAQEIKHALKLLKKQNDNHEAQNEM